MKSAFDFFRAITSSDIELPVRSNVSRALHLSTQQDIGCHNKRERFLLQIKANWLKYDS